MEKGHPLLVALNTNDQLVVYSNNNAIWKGGEKYPALGFTVNKTPDRLGLVAGRCGRTCG